MAAATTSTSTRTSAAPMTDALHWITDPLQYEFMKRALVEVLVTGVVTGVIGAYIVLRGLSFIGDALSHAIFPGIVIAFLLGQSIFLGAIAFGVLTSAAIAVVSTSSRVKEDTAIGVMFAGAFALGIVLISSSRNFTRDLAAFLFGNVLGATENDIILSVVVSAVVLLLVVLFYRDLLIASFDRVAAQAMGIKVLRLDLLLLLMISLTIVVSLRAVGNILVVAMLVTPAAAARLLTDRLPVMMALSATIGGLAGVAGLIVSFHADVAAGGTIVLVATGIFVLVWLFAPNHGFVVAKLARRSLAEVTLPEAGILFESPQIRAPGPH
jgi:manganese/iron transport system permease protein